MHKSEFLEYYERRVNDLVQETMKETCTDDERASISVEITNYSKEIYRIKKDQDNA